MGIEKSKFGFEKVVRNGRIRLQLDSNLPTPKKVAQASSLQSAVATHVCKLSPDSESCTTALIASRRFVCEQLQSESKSCDAKSLQMKARFLVESATQGELRDSSSNASKALAYYVVNVGKKALSTPVTPSVATSSSYTPGVTDPSTMTYAQIKAELANTVTLTGARKENLEAALRNLEEVANPHRHDNEARSWGISSMVGVGYTYNNKGAHQYFTLGVGGKFAKFFHASILFSCGLPQYYEGNNAATMEAPFSMIATIGVRPNLHPNVVTGVALRGSLIANMRVGFAKPALGLWGLLGGELVIGGKSNDKHHNIYGKFIFDAIPGSVAVGDVSTFVFNIGGQLVYEHQF